MARTCAEAASALIAEDTGRSPEEAMLLAIGLTGIAQVTARYWVATQGAVPRDAAAQLTANLVWRGVAGFPRREG